MTVSAVKLATPCTICGASLELTEADGQQVALCRRCELDDYGVGATPADALDDYLNQRPLYYRPTELASFIVPSHPWILEVAGERFLSLEAAEHYGRATGAVIYCRPAQRRAANQKETP